MFRVIRVWDDGDSSMFRYTAARFDTKLEASKHRLDLQNRFPKYVFWISEGEVTASGSRAQTLKIDKEV